MPCTLPPRAKIIVLLGLYHDKVLSNPPLKIYAFACIIVSERVYYLTVLHNMHDRHTMLLLHQSTCKGAYLLCFHLITLTIIPQPAQSIVQHAQRAVEKSSTRSDIETRICFRK